MLKLFIFGILFLIMQPQSVFANGSTKCDGCILEYSKCLTLTVHNEVDRPRESAPASMEASKKRNDVDENHPKEPLQEPALKSSVENNLASNQEQCKKDFEKCVKKYNCKK